MSHVGPLTCMTVMTSMIYITLNTVSKIKLFMHPIQMVDLKRSIIK